MSIFKKFFGKEDKISSAVTAKDRLKLILINERGVGGVSPEYLPRLQKELIDVISRYVKINPKDIHVLLETQDELEVLEVKIELPTV